MSLEALEAYVKVNTLTKDKNATIGTGEPRNTILIRNIEKEKANMKLHKMFSDNILKSEELRVKINNDISRGEDVIVILKESIECISLMTGDVSFMSNIDKLNKVE